MAGNARFMCPRCAPGRRMAKQKLTTDLLKNVLPEPGKRLELRDDQTPGLIFRVTPAGQRSWSYRYRSPAGEQRRKTIGEFPSVGLAEARRRASVTRGEVSGGADPVQTERDDRKAKVTRRLRTFSGLAEAYFIEAAEGLHRPDADAKRASTMGEERRIYDKHVEPHFGGWAIADITRAEVQNFVSKQTREAKSRGRACRNIIRQILSYAEWKELIPYNPANKVAAPKPIAKKRMLPDDDLKTFWSACRRPQDVKDLDLSPEMGIALRLAIVTLQRGVEVVGMRWREIDREARTWLIPAERMKGKQEHLVPLSDLALDLLDEAKALIAGKDLVFQSTRTGNDDPRPFERRSFTRAMSRVVETTKISKATPHDFRRTGATNITSERIGIPRFIVSKLIAHGGDTGGAAVVTGKHYDVNDYLPEKRRAMDAWGALLDSIVNGRARPSNVTELRSAG
jgi:integrase